MNQISSLAARAWKAENEQAEAEATLTKDSCEQEQKQDKHRKKPVSEMGGKASLLTTSLTFDVVLSGGSKVWEQLDTDSAKQRLAEEQTERVREVLVEEQIHRGEEGGEHIEEISGAGQKRRRHGGDEKK